MELDEKTLKRYETRFREMGVSRRGFMKIAAMVAGSSAALTPLAPFARGAVAAPRTVAAQDAAGPTTGEEQIFYHFALQEDPNSFDFNKDLYAAGEPETWAGLLTFDQDFNVLPDWAERWESNADGSVWTFYLRPNNTGFSNGDPVTAETFVYSFKRLLDPANAAAYGFILLGVKNASAFNNGDQIDGRAPTADDLGLRAIDEWTLEMTMEGPQGNLPQIVAYLSCVPCHPASVEQYGDNWALGDVPLVSNGPFKLDRWEHDVRVEVSKNENYWDAENVFLTKVIDPITPAAQSTLAFEQNKLDWTPVPGSELSRYQNDPELSQLLQQYVYPGIWQLVPSNGIPPFDKVEVRRALSHAIDRERIASVTNGLALPALQMIPNGLFGYIDDPAITDIQKYDPQLAMDALVGTEYEGGQNWPSIVMSMRGSEEVYNADVMAADIVAQLEEVLNMKVEIEVIPLTSFSEIQFQNKMQLIWIRWWYDYPDPANGYGDMYYSRKSSGKRQAWSNAQFDDLVEQGAAELVPEQRLEIYKQAEKLIQEDVGYIPVVFRVDQYAFKPWVKNVPINQQGYVVAEGNIYTRMLTQVYIEGRPAS